MVLQIDSESGSVFITDHCLAVIAGSAAMECYGLVGMASRKQLKDGIAELLGRENWTRGVVIRRENERLHIDLHIIVSYGIRISEVAHNIQTKVEYVMREIAGLQVEEVNIFVQDVRVSS
ncbi:Asp23/Gls24 family envelope stress response protein [Paenibacillus chungangensis]|uniref:Asp23/Gls24 family envelope stress response protein n=1 Tax=Paenibacillus chungangensis TaxID=696535 RepID=A0ABW3HPL4_9BACL